MIKESGLFPAEDMTESDRSLHTPGNFAKKNLLYVQEVGHLQSLRPHRCIREKLGSFLFLIVLEGRGSLEVNGKHYDLQQGCCAFVDCMEHYEHISDETDAWRLAWVHFNGNQARGYYDLFYRYNEGNVFTVENVEIWNKFICNLLERQRDKSLLAELECGELLLHMLNRVMGSVSDMSILMGESERRLANEIREYLNEQYAAKDVLDALEDNFGEDFVSLSRNFKRFFGINIEEYISNRRLNAAKEMLRFSVRPIEEVAVESGIGDVITLQQIFNTSEGVSAEEYRMKWAQWIRGEK